MRKLECCGYGKTKWAVNLVVLSLKLFLVNFQLSGNDDLLFFLLILNELPLFSKRKLGLFWCEIVGTYVFMYSISPLFKYKIELWPENSSVP